MLIKPSKPAETGDPNAVNFASFVAFSDASVGLLFTKNTDLVARIEEMVFPFRVEAAITSTGIGLNGDEVGQFVAGRIFEAIIENVPQSYDYQPARFQEIMSKELRNCLKMDLAFRLKGVPHAVKPMCLGQVAYMQDLLAQKVPLVFGVGPTGTGKTHLAIAAGLSLLATEKIQHLVITRPHHIYDGDVVTRTAREDLDRDDQFTVFYDILHDLIRQEEIDNLTAHGKLEIVPLGQMRGRTFNQSMVILDEAQDMTVSKMRMAVTRMGRNSRTIVTGDPSQASLRTGEQSGLQHLMTLVGAKDFARIHHFDNDQIIRNETVARLEKLYADLDVAS